MEKSLRGKSEMMLRKFLCKIGWHKPGKSITLRGVNFTGQCKYCHKYILQDSQGNWF